MLFVINWSRPEPSVQILRAPGAKYTVHSIPLIHHIPYSRNADPKAFGVRRLPFDGSLELFCPNDVRRKASNPVSELVFLVFTDRYRAPEVLNELRRRDGLCSEDLGRAVAVTLDSEARASVHMIVELSKREGVGWARVWGSLLNSALFIPLTEGMVEAANEVGLSSKRIGLSLPKDSEEPNEARWWRESLQESENFKRDLSALITANSSAILMLLRTTKISKALQDLRNYGSTIVHTTVSTPQDDKLSVMLKRNSRLKGE
jgi:uncharacterized membrane protein